MEKGIEDSIRRLNMILGTCKCDIIFIEKNKEGS